MIISSFLANGNNNKSTLIVLLCAVVFNFEEFTIYNRELAGSNTNKSASNNNYYNYTYV